MAKLSGLGVVPPFWFSQTRATSLEEQIPPNALRRKRDPAWRGGFSLGLDLGMSRTGLALSKGFYIRPLTVTTSLCCAHFLNSLSVLGFMLSCLCRRFLSFEARSLSFVFSKSLNHRYRLSGSFLSLVSVMRDFGLIPIVERSRRWMSS